MEMERESKPETISQSIAFASRAVCKHINSDDVAVCKHINSVAGAKENIRRQHRSL